MDTTIEGPESNMKNGMVSSSSQYKTKVTSLRRMVRGARQSMERRGDRNFNSKKRTKHKEEPTESETQETTLSESVREVGLEGQSRHASQRRETPFCRVLKGMPFLREDSEVSLGSVGASLKRMGSKRAMLADSSWGRIQTSMRGFGTDSLWNAKHSAPTIPNLDDCASEHTKSQLEESSGHDSFRSLGSWGDLCVDNQQIVDQLDQSLSSLLQQSA